MFCALKGATRQPRRARERQIAVAIQLFPTWDAVPATIKARAIMLTVRAGAVAVAEFETCRSSASQGKCHASCRPDTGSAEAVLIETLITEIVDSNVPAHL